MLIFACYGDIIANQVKATDVKKRRYGGFIVKREFLKELGLTDEQIDKIMAENGKDIEKAKGDLAAKETELESAKKQLKTANAEIESYKSMDVEGIKAAADDYKAKFEQAEKDAKAKLEKLQFEHALENALVAAKAKNAKAVKALLDIEGLKFNNGEIIGLKEQLEKIQEENDYLFEAEGGIPQVVKPGSNGGGAPNKNPWSKEHFNLTEQGKILRSNPKLAEQLKAAAK